MWVSHAAIYRSTGFIPLIRLLIPEPEDTRATEFYSATAGYLSRPLL
jgi:hypothetical protein